MQTKIKIVTKSVSELKLYENNPRNNDKTVDMLIRSIDDFGIVKPILIDGDNVIVDGEAIFKAAKRLSKTQIPCIIVDELTEEQIKALRLVLNKTQEFTSWTFEKLAEELSKIDIDLSTYEFPDFDNMALDISDEDFLQDTEIVREHKNKTAVCPKCGNEFEL